MIAEAQAAYPQVSLRHLCALYDVNRDWGTTRPGGASGDAQETALRDAIERIVLDFPGYGYRHVTKALQRDGRPVNH